MLCGLYVNQCSDANCLILRQPAMKGVSKCSAAAAMLCDLSADLRTADTTIAFDPLKYEAQTIMSIENKDAQALNPRAFTTCRRNLVQVLHNPDSNKTN